MPRPRRRTAPTARLARAILRIDRHPMPAHLPETTVEMLRRTRARTYPVRCARSWTAPTGSRPLLTRALAARRARDRSHGAHDVRDHHARRAPRRTT